MKHGPYCRKLSDEEERDRGGSTNANTLRHLCNNILHAVKIGGSAPGSNLHGLRLRWYDRPAQQFTSVKEYPKLEEYHRGLPTMKDKTHDYDETDIAEQVRGV